jgi:carboxymethylenebutenolidase
MARSGAPGGDEKGVAVTHEAIQIETADGVCPAVLSSPEGTGPWPGVILFPDAGGMRETMREMGTQLSQLGYVVLVPDFYYRNGPYEPVDMRTAFATKERAAKMMEMIASYSAQMLVTDAQAFADVLEGLPRVRRGGLGTTGYCLGGRLSLLAAAALGRRVAAAASFHGGNLAKEEDPDSPHHKAGEISAAVYVAGASEDPSFTDGDKALLDRSLEEAGVVHTIETYQAQHGFAVPDHPHYDPAAAERHWTATEQFFASALGS